MQIQCIRGRVKECVSALALLVFMHPQQTRQDGRGRTWEEIAYVTCENVCKCKCYQRLSRTKTCWGTKLVKKNEDEAEHS